jgi:hypothetical protein
MWTANKVWYENLFKARTYFENLSELWGVRGTEQNTSRWGGLMSDLAVFARRNFLSKLIFGRLDLTALWARRIFSVDFRRRNVRRRIRRLALAEALIWPLHFKNNWWTLGRPSAEVTTFNRRQRDTVVVSVSYVKLEMTRKHIVWSGSKSELAVLSHMSVSALNAGSSRAVVE